MSAPNVMEAPSERLRALLVECGYEIVERQGPTIEVLLLRGEEAWFGRGQDANQALRDASLRALPPGLAQELLGKDLVSSRMERQ